VIAGALNKNLFPLFGFSAIPLMLKLVPGMR
jgi:hypothetical protein